MRKLILLSSVFALSMGVFAQKEADAFLGLFSAATGIGQATVVEQNQTQDRIKEVRDETQDVEQAVKDNTTTLKDEINERFMNLYLELRGMSEQLTTVNAAGVSAHAGFANGINQSGAIVAQQRLQSGAMTTYVNAGGQNCVLASGGKGGAAVNEGAEAEEEKLSDEGMDLIAAKAGTDAENGVVDFLRLLSDESDSFGDTTDHVNFATIFAPDAYEDDDP